MSSLLKFIVDKNYDTNECILFRFIAFDSNGHFRLFIEKEDRREKTGIEGSTIIVDQETYERMTQ